MSLFEPAGTDGRALWRTAYDLLRDVPVGEVLEYPTLETALDRPRAKVQSAMGRAVTELLTIDKRTVVAVPNVGYRVIEPEEHMTLARQRQKRSNKQLQRGRAVATHVDFNNMPPDVRKAFETVAQAFSMQLDFNRRLDVRQNKLEQQISDLTPKVERSAEEIDALRKRLEALEQKD